MPDPSERHGREFDRRRFLKATGTGALTVGLAGCGQQGGDGESSPTETPSPTDEPTPTPTVTPEPVEPGEDVPKGGTFRLGLPEPPKGINILSTSSAYSAAIYDNVYAGGIFVDPVTYEVKPWVYTDWTVENVDSGAPDVYFNVREGLTWNDGEDFTLDDVLFTYDYLLEQQPGKYVSLLEPIDSVEEAGNDWDVHMQMNKPVGTYDSTQLAFPLLPEHIWSEVDNFQQYQPGQQVSEGRPVGLGPAVVTRYEPDTAIELEFRDPEEYQLSRLQWMQDHPNLRAGGPFLDRVRYLVYTSQSARVEAFFNDEIDSMYQSIPSSSVDRIRETDGLSLVQGSDTGFGWVGFNLRRVPFDDITFRQAMGFLWDDIYWTSRLNRDLVFEGDFVMPPAYSAVRPETASEDAEVLESPATQAFTFRQSGAGVPDIQGIRSFLTEGQAITGEQGTFVGQDYPGSLTGVSASQTESKHEYTFGPVQSQVLKDYGADQEIRINGQTIGELHGGPLTYHTYPPQLVPELTKMDENYTQNMKALGIPIERMVISFNSLLDAVFAREDFDITHLGWGDLSPFATSSLYNLYHGDNADDHGEIEEGSEEENDSRLLNNPMGYGLFDDATANDLIAEARTEMDAERRNELARQAVEKIYLDFPLMVFDYDKLLWPVKSSAFTGFIQGIAGPGDSELSTQYLNIHQRE